jgi:hypothetical protein
MIMGHLKQWLSRIFYFEGVICKIILYAFTHNIVNFLCQCSKFIQNFWNQISIILSFYGKQKGKEDYFISFVHLVENSENFKIRMKKYLF